MRGEAGSEMYRNAMLVELQANAHKEGWDTFTVKDHFREIDYHVAKLKAAVLTQDLNRILEYGADVGNHVWFLLEQQDVLTPERIVERAAEPAFQQALPATYKKLMFIAPRFWRKAWKGLRGPEYERQDVPSLDGFG